MNEHPLLRLTDPVDVVHSSGGKVVVDNQVDALEVDSTRQQSRADQHPDLPRTETAHNIVPLRHKETLLFMS